MPVFVGDFIRLNALSRGGDEALVTPERSFTYVEFNRQVNLVASALQARGIGHGDRVAAVGRNSAEYVFLYYAAAKLGALLVPISFWYREGEYRHVLTDSTPSIFFVAPEQRPVVASLITELDLPTVALPTAADRTEWQQFMAGATAEDEPQVQLAEEDPHMILYTSGTTGRPKGAILSHRRTTDDAMAMSAAIGITPADTFVNFFPSFHVGNWDHMKVYHLMGGRVILLPQFDPGLVWETIEKHRVTVLLAVPAMFHELLGHPLANQVDHTSVRIVYYGAYDPSGLMREVAEKFGVNEGRCRMYHTYGLTEGGPFVAICHHHELFDHFGSIGRAMPGVEIALLGLDGEPVAGGQPGEICVRGPRMSGYWNRPEDSAAALAGGWLHTGDVAVADEDGYLQIVDRMKDVIRSGGHNVFSKEIENCLLLRDDIDDCAVIGVPDPIYEENVVAVVVLHEGLEGRDATAQEIKDYVRRELAGYNVPREVHFVDQLPKSSVGKTLKHQLRSTYGSIFEAGAHGVTP